MFHFLFLVDFRILSTLWNRQSQIRLKIVVLAIFMMFSHEVSLWDLSFQLPFAVNQRFLHFNFIMQMLLNPSKFISIPSLFPCCFQSEVVFKDCSQTWLVKYSEVQKAIARVYSVKLFWEIKRFRPFSFWIFSGIRASPDRT